MDSHEFASTFEGWILRAQVPHDRLVPHVLVDGLVVRGWAAPSEDGRCDVIGLSLADQSEGDSANLSVIVPDHALRSAIDRASDPDRFTVTIGDLTVALTRV